MYIHTCTYERKLLVHLCMLLTGQHEVVSVEREVKVAPEYGEKGFDSWESGREERGLRREAEKGPSAEDAVWVEAEDVVLVRRQLGCFNEACVEVGSHDLPHGPLAHPLTSTASSLRPLAVPRVEDGVEDSQPPQARPHEVEEEIGAENPAQEKGEDPLQDADTLQPQRRSRAGHVADLWPSSRRALQERPRRVTSRAQRAPVGCLLFAQLSSRSHCSAS